MVKKITLKFLSGGFFIVSMIFSAMLLTSQAYDGVNFALLLVQSILIDSSKMTFFVISTYLRKIKKYMASTAFLVVFVFLFLISIAASLGYLYNTNLQSSTIDAQSSSGYARNEEMYAAKQTEIANLQQQLTNTAADFDQQINSLPEDHITNRSNLQIAKQSALQGIQANIDRANQELSQINSNFDTIEASDISVTGYSALFGQIAKFMNESRFAKVGKTYTAKDISFFFFAIVAIVFEVSAVMCWHQANATEGDIDISSNEAGAGKGKSSKISNGLRKIGFPGKSVVAKNDNDSPTLSGGYGAEMILDPEARTMGLKIKRNPASPAKSRYSLYPPTISEEPKTDSENDTESTEQYKLYVKTMLENIEIDPKNGKYHSIGYKSIQKKANLSSSEAFQIFNYLKESGSVEVIGMNTYLAGDMISAYENGHEEITEERKIGFLG